MHLNDDELELYALGRATPQQIDSVEEHLLFCERCRQQLDAVEAFAMAARKELAKPEPIRRSFPYYAIAAAIAFLAVAASLYFALGNRNTLPVAFVTLTAMRGEMPDIPASSAVDITLTDTPTSLRAEAVDSNGKAIWNGTTERSRIRIAKNLKAGDYFVRTFATTGELLHEYGFRVTAPE